MATRPSGRAGINTIRGISERHQRGQQTSQASSRRRSSGGLLDSRDGNEGQRHEGQRVGDLDVISLDNLGTVGVK